MAINISKVLVESLKASILGLVECCLRLSDVFYFSSICIEDQGQHFFNCVLKGGGGWKENKERTKRSIRSL